MTKGRALGVLALLVFAGFCVGGGLFVRSVLSGNDTPVPWGGWRTENRDLFVVYEGDSCEEERSVAVRETERDVVVTVRIDDGVGIPFITGCVEDSETFRVRLDAPVGERTVLDGACLEEGHSREACVRMPVLP